ncbi:MAG TPA: hypothetical protein VJ577_11360 [Burkholderiaceae bacterium]|nr:hypothetical protein [Burkholderiaceae bacterium]
METTQQGGAGMAPIDFGSEETRLIHNDETEDEALAGVLATLGEDADASVCIYRQGPGGYRDVMYLTECLPAEFSLSRLQEEFEGGAFRIHVRSGGRLIANKAVKVAPKVNARRAAPDPGLAAVQAQIAGLVQVVERLAQPRENPQQSRMEWLKELQMMREIFSGGQAAPRQSDPIELLGKMLALQKDLGGLVGAASGDSEPGTMTVLMKAMETFAPVLQQAAASKTPDLAGYHANPAMRPAIEGAAPAVHIEAAAPGAAPIESTPTNDQESQMLKMYIRMLIGEAEQNIDPEGYALLITQKLEREQIEQLLKPENWFETLAAFEPAVSPYREWFSDLRDIVFEILTAPGADDTTGESQSGDHHHASAGTANTNTPGNS